MWPFKKRKKTSNKAPSDDGDLPLSKLEGTVTIGKNEWNVREEKRAGPYPQLIVLTTTGGSEMHIRRGEGSEVRHMEDVEAVAADPTYRWFSDAHGVRWEARMVMTDKPGERAIKFVAWGTGVFEAPYEFIEPLGLRADDDLIALLTSLRTSS